MKKTLTFVSMYLMYDKEESGIKPYTIRKDTHRLRNQKPFKVTHIKIRRGYTKKYFIRKVTDVTDWCGWIIFSWNPNKSSKPQASPSARSDNSSFIQDCNHINTDVRFTKKEEVVCLRCNQIIGSPK